MRNADQPDSIANPVEVCLSPDLGVALGTLSETIERFVANESIAGEIPFRLSLALDELVTNSVNYALPDVAEPMLRIRLARDASGVVAQVRGQRRGFQPVPGCPETGNLPGIGRTARRRVRHFFSNTICRQHKLRAGGRRESDYLANEIGEVK